MSRFFAPDGVGVRRPEALYINGAWESSTKSDALEIISPSTEDVIGRVAEAGPTDVDRAVAAARQAFDEGPWPWFSPEERSAALRTLGEALNKRADDLARCWSLQTGVPITVATYGLSNPSALYDYYAALLLSEPIATDCEREGGERAIVVREPVGVVAAIAPWNHPFHLISLKVAPALAMGCTIVAKPAPETPLEALILAECAEEAGLPPGVINVVPADREASDHLVRHAGVDKVSFTGSSATGRRIASICGDRMARASMELGGKSAAIVLDDADIPNILPALVQAGGVVMCGQGCAFFTRVLVSRRRRDDLAEAYAAALKAVVVGDPLDPNTQMGPLSMKRQLDRVTGYVDKGKKEGARIVTGGARPSHLPTGYFFEPTLFVDVDNAMTIVQEEIFGPVISMVTFEDEADAIRIANDSSYGLNGSVFTEDADKAFYFARRIRSGNFTHNGLGYDINFPFGGYKLSGVGREGGRAGLDLYTELKTVYMPSSPARIY